MSKRILIVGDAMLDVEYRGAVTRSSQEAPVPVLEACALAYYAGGAANVAKNAAAMGGAVKFISCAGTDPAGATLRQKCVGLDTSWIYARGTTQKTRFFCSSGMLLRMDHDYVCREDEARLVYETVANNLHAASILVLSDYAKGALGFTALMIKEATEQGVPVLVDPKGCDWRRYAGATWVKANRREAEEAATEAKSLVRHLPDVMNVENLIVTDEGRPPQLFAAGRSCELPVYPPQSVSDVTGGGDSYVAAMAVSLASGAGLAHALRYAALAGCVAVSNPGTYIVTREDVANVSIT